MAELPPLATVTQPTMPQGIGSLVRREHQHVCAPKTATQSWAWCVHISSSTWNEHLAVFHHLAGAKTFYLRYELSKSKATHSHYNHRIS